MSALCQKHSLLALRKQTDHVSASREEGKRVRRLTRALSDIYSRAVFAISLCRSEALEGIARPILQSRPRTVLNHRRTNMMKFPSTFDDESLFTYEVSDEVLETAGGKEIAAIFTLGSCTGLSECPA